MSAYRETVTARGHRNVTAEHASTFEITTDDYLTSAGDCILAVDADRAPADFDPAFVEACRDETATISIVLETANNRQTITGRGDPGLELTSERSLVGRTSEYVDERTVVVGAETAASGIARSLVDDLTAGEDLTVTIRVDRDGGSISSPTEN